MIFKGQGGSQCSETCQRGHYLDSVRMLVLDTITLGNVDQAESQRDMYKPTTAHRHFWRAVALNFYLKQCAFVHFYSCVASADFRFGYRTPRRIDRLSKYESPVMTDWQTLASLAIILTSYCGCV